MIDALIRWFRLFDSALVAFSGGVDSTVVAKAAQIALGGKTKAVTAWGPSSCAREPEEAAEIAKSIGISHLLFESREFADPEYLRNDENRCYYCKKIRFLEMILIAKEQGYQVVLDGSNAEDFFDYRPGKRAAEELGVRSPLAELGFTKQAVRDIAKQWGLPNWDKPPYPCLSTRVAYGKELSEELLRRVENAETLLKTFGFSSLRVRVPVKATARIEVPIEQVARLWEPDVRDTIVKQFRELGFQHISVDLQGYRSGSMNVKIEGRGQRAEDKEPRPTVANG